MGCGASKGGADAVVPSQLPGPPAVKTEFTPENKPSLASQPDETSRTIEPTETAKRVDDIVPSAVAKVGEDTDPKEDKPVLAGPVAVVAVPVPVLPSPPSTPPAAAKKPLSQQSTGFGSSDGRRGAFVDPEPDVTEVVSYFPEQVALKVSTSGAASGPVGGSGTPARDTGAGSGSGALTGFSQFQPTPVKAASLQVSESQRARPMGGFQPVPSGRILNPPSQQQQQQQTLPYPSTFQPAPSGRMQQSQPQPLSESGPGLSDRYMPSAVPSAISGIGSSSAHIGSTSIGGQQTQQPAAAPASDDPWSSLQSQYRIAPGADPTDDPDLAGPYGSRGGVGAGSVRGALPPDAGKEVLVLGDDDDFGGGHGMTLNSTMNRTARGAQAVAAVSRPPPGGAPKKGGWGSGEMARAGELMIGQEDDWLDKDRPPGLPPVSQLPPPPGARYAAGGPAAGQPLYGGGQGRDEFDDEEEEGVVPAVKGPAAKGRPADDVQCEDIEDVDSLLEDEMERHGLTNKNLASKLAAYEAQYGAEDD